MDEPLDDRKRAMIEEAVPRVRGIADHYCRRAPAYLHDEIQSAMGWGLVLAARSFREGEDWAYYSALRVFGTIKDVFKTATRTQTDDALGFDPESREPGPARLTDDQEGFLALIRQIGSDDDRELFTLIFRDGLSVAEAGRVLGWRHGRSWHHYNVASQELRSRIHFEDDGTWNINASSSPGRCFS